MNTAESVSTDGLGEQSAPPVMNGDEVLNRLKAATGSASDGALASFLKVPYSTLASWRRRNSVPMDALIAVSDFSGSSLDWLLLGKSQNGAVQNEGAIRPSYPYASHLAIEYGIKLASIVFGNTVEDLRASCDKLVMSCISTQATIDHIVEMKGGDEAEVRKYMDDWIRRTMDNARAQGRKVD